jgi:hypothetical protein
VVTSLLLFYGVNDTLGTLVPSHHAFGGTIRPRPRSPVGTSPGYRPGQAIQQPFILELMERFPYRDMRGSVELASSRLVGRAW